MIKTIVHTDKDSLSTGILPKFMTKRAACADVAIPKTVTIRPGKSIKVDLLLSFDIPSRQCIKMYPRSSLLIKYGLLSPVSIIDSDYTGHVHWPVVNITNDDVILEAGTRVAQIEVAYTSLSNDWLHEDLYRDNSGFGGTGVI